MHILEIRQDLKNTSYRNEIYAVCEIVRKLLKCMETTEDVNYTDFVYISTLTSKAKSLLDKAYIIFSYNKGV